MTQEAKKTPSADDIRSIELQARESTDRFRSMIELSSDWLWEQDDQFRFTFFSGLLKEKTGLGSNWHLGKRRWDTKALNLTEEDWARHKAQLERHEEFHGLEIQRIDPHGREVWSVLSGRPIFDAAGNFTGYRGIGKDITAPKLAERALRESEARFRALTELSADWYWEQDADLRFVGGTGRESNRMGQRGDVGKLLWELPLTGVSSDQWRGFKEAVAARRPFRDFEYQRDFGDGLRHLSISGEPMVNELGQFTGYRGIGRDVTERHAREIALKEEIRVRQKMEIDLRLAQKLESIGRLASGVAHEINTPVQFVSDSVRFVSNAMTDLTTLVEKYKAAVQAIVAGALPAEIAADLAAAEEDADLGYLMENLPKAIDRSLDGLGRVATIVRSMKEFAHPDRREMATLNLNQSIANTLTVATNEFKYVADVETDYGDIPLVTCHGGDINQVILNLILNAAHAIADVVKGTESRGRIRVGTRREAESVVVTITDTGGGIPEAIRDRIFDPFFTTKEVGRGTGQGLAIARSVVIDKHGGELTFESEMGQGTTFFVRLPIDGTKSPQTGIST
jgi:PAS domain S-box-containing protein